MDQKTVLLVEDNLDNRAIFTVYLRHHGFRVADTASGEVALELARQESPDIIVLDISIEGIDGWTVARRLKGSGETRGIPIIALTAHALPEHEERAREVGCDSYLAKPITPVKVLEEIRRLLPTES